MQLSVVHTPSGSALERLSELARSILSRYQHGFPVAPHPWQVIADELGVSMVQVQAARAELEQSGLVGRIGAVVRPGRVGASTLAAMRVPPQCLEQVAELVNGYRGVNHNYEREDDWNLWFVVTAASEPQLLATLRDIGTSAGLPVLDCRLEKPYHIDLGFPL